MEHFLTFCHFFWWLYVYCESYLNHFQEFGNILKTFLSSITHPFRLSMDHLSSEVNQLNKSLQKMESQLANAAGDVKEQLQDFLKVGSIDKSLCVCGSGWCGEVGEFIEDGDSSHQCCRWWQIQNFLKVDGIDKCLCVCWYGDVGMGMCWVVGRWGEPPYQEFTKKKKKKKRKHNSSMLQVMSLQLHSFRKLVILTRVYVYVGVVVVGVWGGRGDKPTYQELQ